jgi:phosphonoacetaldehyde hydrolase
MEDAKIKAVIFDWAGTTVDFGCVAPVVAIKKIFEEKGIDISKEEVREPMGLKKIDHIRVLLENERIQKVWENKFGKIPDEEDVKTLYAKLEPMIVNTVENYSDPIPGLLETVDKLKNMDIKIGATTGYTAPIMEVVQPAVEKKGYAPDSAFNSSEVVQGRPAPWMCFKNAMELNVFPMHNIAKVGDTVADIKEGIMAGMWTIGVTHSGNELGYSYDEYQNASQDEIASKTKNSQEKLLEAGADYVIDGVWDLMPIIKEINNKLENNKKPNSYSV